MIQQSVAALQRAADDLIFGGKAKGTYRVIRNCCLGGNCISCMHLPVGTTIKVNQITDISLELAEIVKNNFVEYSASIEEGPC